MDKHAKKPCRTICKCPIPTCTTDPAEGECLKGHNGGRIKLLQKILYMRSFLHAHTIPLTLKDWGTTFQRASEPSSPTKLSSRHSSSSCFRGICDRPDASLLAPSHLHSVNVGDTRGSSTHAPGANHFHIDWAWCTRHCRWGTDVCLVSNLTCYHESDKTDVSTCAAAISCPKPNQLLT